MPIAKALSVMMATEWFDRAEGAGSEIVREAHTLGLIGKGRGGGFGGSPDANSAEGVLLLLSLLSGGSGAAESLNEGALLYHMGISGDAFFQLSASPQTPRHQVGNFPLRHAPKLLHYPTLGSYLAAVVSARRRGILRSDATVADSLSILRNRQFGGAFVTTPLPADGGGTVEMKMQFAAALGAPRAAKNIFWNDLQVNFTGGLTRKVAEALGPLPADGRDAIDFGPSDGYDPASIAITSASFLPPTEEVRAAHAALKKMEP